MFSINDFYKQCNDANAIDKNELIDYIKQFKKVIIWGAAGLGAANGRFLLKNGIANIIYWDKRSHEIKECNNIEVQQPFSENDTQKDDCLVIYSIPNHVIMSGLLTELKNQGYDNVIRGDIFYSGLVCHVTPDRKPSVKECWLKDECRPVICEKARTILKNITPQKLGDERIDLTYNCFIINSVCNLNCSHCVQYINNYPPAKKNHIDYKTICADIDSFFDVVDSVNVVSVMGGETFSHPDLDKIIKKFSEIPNFNFVSFPTNGLYPIREKDMAAFKDRRMVIAFGYYLHVATDKQKEVYKKNIELAKKYNVPFTESRYLPTWVIPAKIYRRSYATEEYMTARKQQCLMPPRNLQVREGKVHVCDRSVALHAMGHVDYPEDYFNLEEQKKLSLLERRTNFRDFINRKFYYTCGHCDNAEGIAPSALQGRINVFSAE